MIRHCEHVKSSGRFCASPAMRGRNYCYFHLNLRGRRLKIAQARRQGQNPPLQLPFPEDMHAVQVALGEAIWALADDRVDPKRAGLILYALQQASSNLNTTKEWNGQRQEVDRNAPSRATASPEFERRFGLHPGTDLEAACASLETGPKEDSSFRRHPERSEDASRPNEVEEPAVSTAHENPGPPLSAAPGAPPLSPAVGDRVGVETKKPPRSARVPLPEEQARRLKMTQREQLDYFLYSLAHDIDREDFEAMSAWLRNRRRNQRKPPASATANPESGTESLAASNSGDSGSSSEAA